MAIGTGLTVGSWFASAMISKVIEKLVTYISDQFEYRKDAKPKLDKLKTHLNVVLNDKDKIGDADGAQIQDLKLQLWMAEVGDAVYAAEEVLDRFGYKVLEAQVCASVSRDVLRQTKSVVKHLFFADKDINELVQIADKFETIVSKMGDFSDLPKNPVMSEFWQTSSFPTTSRLFGRDEEKTRLLKLLGTQTDDKSKSQFTTVAIVGMGGLGKTELARHVYNDKSIKSCFDLWAWVWVSHTSTFDPMEITKEIVMQLAPIDGFQSINSLERIHRILKKCLEGKKFLIVIDNVWNLTTGQWEKLCAPFRFASKGSKFILTTRNPGVVRRLGAIQTASLKDIKENPYSSSFKQCAFGDANPARYPELVSIGNEIAKKLKGSPLAAKTVSAVLRSNLDRKHWNNILQSGLWELKQDDDDILPTLRLTYIYLPAHLKQCFAFGALFPTNSVFERESLVRMWIAHDFVQPRGSKKNMEDTGRNYFEELLLDVTFFQRAEEGNRNQYVIHALLHEVARDVSSTEYCVFENNKPIQIPERLRHLCVVGNTLPEVCKNESKMKRLRSLVLLLGDVYLDCKDYQEMFSKLKSLRLLIISRYKGALPSTIGNLIHLRYLHLHPTPTETECLADLFSKLYLLQGLTLRGCITTLPKSINKLISLQYLNVKAGAVSSIPGIGSLTSLRQLPVYRVKRSNGYDIRQLGDMNELRGRLCIKCLEEVPGGEKEATEALLCNKEHLNELRLEWGKLQGRSSLDIKPDSEGVLEGLKPHADLQRLEIARYGGTRSPSWLLDRWLSNLTDIRLEKCKSWKELPPLGQLPKLRVLHLVGLRGVKKIDNNFYGDRNAGVAAAFPSLEELSFSYMDEWKVWSKVEGRPLLPHLSKLSIKSCPNLKGPFPLPSSFQGLIIQSMASASGKEAVEGSENNSSTLCLCLSDTSQLAGWLPAKGLSALRKMQIRGFPKQSFAEEDEWFRHFTSLQQLTFDRCDNLQSLPAQLKQLSSLQTLNITGCPKIKPMPELVLPTSLKELFINGCRPNLALLQCQKKCDPDCLKIAVTPRARILDCHSKVTYDCSPSVAQTNKKSSSNH